MQTPQRKEQGSHLPDLCLGPHHPVPPDFNSGHFITSSQLWYFCLERVGKFALRVRRGKMVLVLNAPNNKGQQLQYREVEVVQ